MGRIQEAMKCKNTANTKNGIGVLLEGPRDVLGLPQDICKLQYDMRVWSCLVFAGRLARMWGLDIAQRKLEVLGLRTSTNT